MAASGDDNLCPDWIYSESSNVHVAKDRSWFTTYHPIQSQITSLYNIGAPTPALGIGTITLTVKPLPGSFVTSTIELHNVLHVPNYICNVLGRPLKNSYTVNLGGSAHEGGPPSRGGLFLSGVQIAYFQPGPISIFSLAVLPPLGKNFGPSPFQGGAAYVVSCQWAETERLRWQAIRDAEKEELRKYESPYTIREMEFVNEQWGTEYRFLVEHGLSILEEGDRSEGRKMVRALMEADEGRKKDIEIGEESQDYENPDVM